MRSSIVNGNKVATRKAAFFGLRLGKCAESVIKIVIDWQLRWKECRKTVACLELRSDSGWTGRRDNRLAGVIETVIGRDNPRGWAVIKASWIVIDNTSEQGVPWIVITARKGAKVAPTHEGRCRCKRRTVGWYSCCPLGLSIEAARAERWCRRGCRFVNFQSP
jgi:hypothetical protein